MATGYRASFELTGEMPLLMHWDNIEGGDQLKAWRQATENKNQSVPGDDRSPAWTWHTYLYTDGEYVTMPQDNIMAALMNGGAQIILKKQKTYKELSQSGILIATEHCEFSFDGGKRLSTSQLMELRDLPYAKQAEAAQNMGFRLFCKRAGVNKSKHVRVRPRFETWTVKGELQVISPDLPFDTLVAIFGYAGRAGLCDWRPSSPKRPGPYGMFTAKLKQLK